MSGSVETAYDCKRPPEGKTFTICNLYYLASGERTPQIYHWLRPALAFIVESRVETHIWRHMYSFQLLVCVCVPEAFFHSCAWPCSSAVFLCFSLCMCMCVCVYVPMCVSGCVNYWHWAYSFLPRGHQPGNLARLFFFFQYCCFSKPLCNSSAK